MQLFELLKERELILGEFYKGMLSPELLKEYKTLKLKLNELLKKIDPVNQVQEQEVNRLIIESSNEFEEVVLLANSITQMKRVTKSSERRFIQKAKSLNDYTKRFIGQDLMSFTLKRNGFTLEEYIQLVNDFRELTSEVKASDIQIIKSELSNELIEELLASVGLGGLINGFEKDQGGQLGSAQALYLNNKIILNQEGLTDIVNSYRLIIHELGHLIHGHFIKQREKDPLLKCLLDSPGVTESMAYVLEYNVFKPNFLEKIGVSEDYKNNRVLRSRRISMYALIEVRMYQQDFKEPSNIFKQEKENFGEELIHERDYLKNSTYLTNPTYYPAYLLADLFATTILNQVEKNDLVLGEVLKEFFYDGPMTSWREKMTNAFGQSSTEWLLNNYREY